jgi:hypothetical protein
MDTNVENDEIRMTSDETNPNYQIVVRPFQFRTLSDFAEAPSEGFEMLILSSFDIRASSFFSSCLFVCIRG